MPCAPFLSQDLIDAAKQQLSMNRQRLHQLYATSGMTPPDDSQAHGAFKQVCTLDVDL